MRTKGEVQPAVPWFLEMFRKIHALVLVLEVNGDGGVIQSGPLKEEKI